jgi:hypothetical protein
MYNISQAEQCCFFQWAPSCSSKALRRPLPSGRPSLPNEANFELLQREFASLPERSDSFWYSNQQLDGCCGRLGIWPARWRRVSEGSERALAERATPLRASGARVTALMGRGNLLEWAMTLVPRMECDAGAVAMQPQWLMQRPQLPPRLLILPRLQQPQRDVA